MGATESNHVEEPATGELETTGVSTEVVQAIGDAFNNKPAGFTVHPKIQQLLTKRLDMSRNGKFLYVFKNGTGTVGAFAVANDGSLTPMADTPGLAVRGGYMGLAAY